MTGSYFYRSSFQRWSINAALAAAAAVGMGTAHADTTDEIIAQAVSEANQGSAVLDAAPTADLSARQADFLLSQQSFDQNSYFLEQIGTQQDLVSAGDQPFLAGADEHLVTAAQALLASDQAFVTADQAGELSSSSFNSVDLGVIEANFGLEGAELNALGDSFLAIFDPDISTGAATSAAAAADPATVLNEATTNYADANQFLGEIPSGEFASVSGAVFQQDIDMQDIASLGLSENAISAYDNGVLADFLNPVFGSVNQGWDQASEAALNADQALETAVAGGSSTDISAALLGLIEPTYQALGPDLDSGLIDLGAHLLTGVDPFTAGLDSVSAVDPGIVADVLSSIGF